MDWRYIMVITLAFLSSGCLGEDIEELPFTEVELVQARPGIDVGTVELRAETGALESGSLDEYGFLYATEIAALEPPASGAGRVIFEQPLLGLSFDTVLSGLNINQTHYVRAYIRQGERMVYSEVSALAFSVQLGVTPFFELYNDTAIVEGFISGFESLPSTAEEYGHVYSSTMVLPEYGQAQRTSFQGLSGDVNFRSMLPGLEFNTTYQVRAYLRSAASNVYYSNNTLALQVGGGWRSVPGEFSFSLLSAASVAIDSVAYIVLGLKDGSSTKQFVRYSPFSGEWEVLAPYEGFALSNAVAFAIDQVFYAGFGVTSGGYLSDDLWAFDTQGGTGWTETEKPPSTMLGREGAVAFVLDKKVYIGTGRAADEQLLNDLWEFDLNRAEGEKWRRVASLPAQDGPSVSPNFNRGRTEAVAMVINGIAYVGGGATGQAERRDYWEFVPPISEIDTGQWVLHSWFPEEGLSGSIAMTIGDKGYVGTGFRSESSFFKDLFYEFDPAASDGNYWQQTAPFLGGGARDAIAFSIGGKGYVGMGQTKVIGGEGGFQNKPLRKVWEYTPTID